MILFWGLQPQLTASGKRKKKTTLPHAAHDSNDDNEDGVDSWHQHDGASEAGGWL